MHKTNVVSKKEDKGLRISGISGNNVEWPKTPSKMSINASFGLGNSMNLSSGLSLIDTDSMEELMVADYIVNCLVQYGVTYVFGGHGGAVVPLINAICKHPKLTWVYTRCAVNASLAAAAYAKVTDGLGCCVGSCGPGASHLTTGLLDADLDRCSVICVTGQSMASRHGYSDFQDINQTEMFHAVGLSYSCEIIHKNAVVPLLRDALCTAVGRSRCAHVAIPLDIQQKNIIVPSNPLQSCFTETRKQRLPSCEDIERVAEYLVKSHKEGLYMITALGHRAFADGEEILRLAEMLGTPVVTSQDAKGCVREDHDQVVGVLGVFGNPGLEATRKIVETSELVISIGVDEHSQLVVGSSGVQTRLLVEIDLEGLHDSRFQATQVLCGSGQGCISSICSLLADKVQEIQNRMTGESTQRRTRKGTLDRVSSKCWGEEDPMEARAFKVNSLHQRAANYVVPEDEISKGFCHPGRVLALLGPKLKEKCTVCIDVGDCALWTSLCLCLNKKGQRGLASLRMGTMGYSICAAMGTAAAKPDEQIVAIAGDGAVQMATTELQTLQQMRVKHVLIIIFVNEKLGRVHNEVWGPADAGKPEGCSISNPDYCLLAEAHGGKGLRLTESDPDLVSKVLDEALSTPGLCILEVKQNPDVKPCMAKKTR
jgi:thiamine pyrophosphate-dependent acetolactate synthase large subunit-like protein